MIRTYSENEALINKKRALIAACAVPLFLQNGYHKTSIRELASRCKMSEGAIYRYIGSKEDILSLIAQGSRLSALSLRKYYHKLVDVTPTQALQLCIKKYMVSSDEDKDFILFTNREIKNFPKSDRDMILQAEIDLMEVFKEIIHEGINKGEFKTDNVDIVAYNILMLAHDWSLWQWHLRDGFNLNKFIKVQTDLIINAIKNGWR